MSETSSESTVARHVYLIDGSGYIFRAFHALPPMNRPDGTPTNAVFGFTSMMLKLRDDAEDDGAADYMAVIFDTARQTFRNEIYPEYKANRPDPPEELVPQFALIREATRALNLPAIEMAGYEADDLIATYARRAAAQGTEVTIVSSDKDLMQLVGDGITMLDPMKNRPIGPAEVVERFGVGPEKVVDVQALAGDSTDNVPGVPGIGVKTAAELINTYGDLDTLLARAEEIKQPKRRERLLEHAELARISRELVRLKDDVPVAESFESFTLKPLEPDSLIDFLKAQDFKRILTRIEGRFAEAGAIEAQEMTRVAAVEGEYELIQSAGALDRWIDDARFAGMVAVDTETTSLDAMRAELVGISLSLEPGRACYIPVAHMATDGQGSLELESGSDEGESAAPVQIPLADVIDRLRPLFEDPGVLKIGHNIKYDMLVLSRPPYEVRIAPVDDSMVLSYVLEGGLHGHGLDELARLHVDHEMIKFKDVAGTGKAQVTFDKVALDDALDYAAEDADYTGRLHRMLKPRLIEAHMVTVYETLDRALIPVLVDMERMGILADVGELRRLSDDFAGRIVTLEQEIHELAGHELNIGSPKQLGEVLFDEMSLPGGKKSGKSGAYATGADVLENLAAQGHELPARVLEWRQLSKLKSTYTDTLVEQINPTTGRVHTSYAMAVANTGRLSSTDPNLQNIPVRTEEGRKIRKAFIAEDGWKLLSLDYSQIELRLLAHVASIDALKQAFQDGIDIHALTASQVFGEPVESMSPDTRRRAKAINFGIIYGISAFGLGRQLGIPQKDAAKYIDAYFERYPGIRDYMEMTREFCRHYGYVETIFGRRVHLPGINDSNPARRGFAQRQAINAPLQGSAADIIKRAMIRIPDAIRANGLKARMLLQVHDELLFEVPEAEVGKTGEAMSEVMESVAHLSVPLVVETGVGDSWAEAH